MARILCFDTSTHSCTVAVSVDGAIVAVKESVDSGYVHAEKLNPYIEEAMTMAELKMSELDAIAVGKGPGSYTGLRIGVSTAKGLAYALRVPLISMSSLQILASQVVDSIPDGELIAPMLDARRMEVFTSVFDKQLVTVSNISAEVIDQDSFQSVLTNRIVHFLGDGMEKCREVLSASGNARFIADIEVSARFMSHVTQSKLNSKEFEDVAYFEPFYLKEFKVGVPKKLV